MLKGGSPDRSTSPGPLEPIGICHIISGDLWAGAEVQVATLLRALMARNEFRVNAIFLNEGRLAEEARDCGVNVTVIPEHRHGFFGILSKAVQFLRRNPVQILHSHRCKENILAAALAWRERVPFVVRSQHGLPEPLKGFASVKDAAVRQADRLAAHFSTDCIISVSKELSGHISRYFRTIKVVVIPNGIDTRLVKPTLGATEAKKRLGIPSDCLVVGTAGRLEPVKRLDIFLKAAGFIAQRLPKSRFIIAGDGRELARLKELAKLIGLGDRVLFLGHRQDIYDVLQAFEVFVLSSDHEGLPMILLEALFLGKGVAGRRVGGIVEVISHGENGILVESADPEVLAQTCIELLTDGDQLRKFAQTGPLRVIEGFSADAMADQTAAVYRSLMGVNRSYECKGANEKVLGGFSRQ